MEVVINRYCSKGDRKLMMNASQKLLRVISMLIIDAEMRLLAYVRFIVHYLRC